MRFSICTNVVIITQNLTGLLREWLHGSGVGVAKAISSVPLFFNFSALLKHAFAIEYHVYIWQVSPQFSFEGTCQIYKCDSNNLRNTFTRSKFFMEKLTNWALVTGREQ